MCSVRSVTHVSGRSLRIKSLVESIGAANPADVGHSVQGLWTSSLPPRAESPLSPAERELIAAYVSSRNECVFCTSSHAAASRALYGEHGETVDATLADPATAPISDRLRALLVIAGKVQVNGKLVTPEDVEAARREGADDRAIHDTVLIAAAFSMFNRYVDGLAAWTPTDPEMYAEMGRWMAGQGYAGRFDQVVEAVA